MLGSAVQRLLHLHAVAPGGKAVVVTANDDGWEVAADLHRAGVEVAAIADERGPGDNPRAGELEAAGIEVCYRHSIAAARGGSAVEGAVVAALGPDGQPRPGSERSFDCDLVSLSVGWAPAPDLAYMAGARAVYDEECAAILPTGLPPGLFVAGGANGTRNLEDQRAEGLFAGASAAAGLGLGPSPGPRRRPRGRPEAGHLDQGAGARQEQALPLLLRGRHRRGRAYRRRRRLRQHRAAQTLQHHLHGAVPGQDVRAQQRSSLRPRQPPQRAGHRQDHLAPSRRPR